MKEKSYKKKEKEIIDSSIGWKEFRAKENYEGGLRFFCKQLWRDLNENVWGKLIILTGIIFLIGNIVIIITEAGRIAELIFIIFLGILFCFLIIIYTAKTLHKKEEDEEKLSLKEQEEREKRHQNKLKKRKPMLMTDKEWIDYQEAKTKRLNRLGLEEEKAYFDILEEN